MKPEIAIQILLLGLLFCPVVFSQSAYIDKIEYANQFDVATANTFTVTVQNASEPLSGTATCTANGVPDVTATNSGNSPLLITLSANTLTKDNVYHCKIDLTDSAPTPTTLSQTVYVNAYAKQQTAIPELSDVAVFVIAGIVVATIVFASRPTKHSNNTR